MGNALGQLANAPLIYVLAQIRFPHIPRMDKRWEDFHEKVFDSYPKAEVETITQIAFKEGQPTAGDSIKQWHLNNESKTSGIILEPGMLVYHTTDYQKSDAFLSELQRLLDAFIQVLPEKGMSVSRMGLRYVDLLIEEDGLSVDQQVIEPLRIPKLDNIGSAQRLEQIITYKTSIDGTMSIRHRQSTTTNVLPADIFPNKLKHAPRFKKERPDNTIVGLLDYDHYIEKEQPFDITTIIETFNNLHKISSAAFEATTTKEAFDTWRKEINR